MAMKYKIDLIKILPKKSHFGLMFLQAKKENLWNQMGMRVKTHPIDSKAAAVKIRRLLFTKFKEISKEPE